MNSPGVSIKEIDFSEYVQSASEVSAGVIGGARRGPITPTHISSQEQLIKVFGEPIPGDYGIYGALAALTQTNSIYYQRVISKGEKAVAGKVGTDKFTYVSKEYGEEYNDYTIEQTAEALVDIGDGEMANRFSVMIKGPTGNLLEKYEVLSSNSSDPDYIIKVINAKSLIIKVVANDTGLISDKTLNFVGGVSGATFAYAGEDNTEYKFRSKYYDSTINGGKAIISAEDDFGYFDFTLVDSDDKVIEIFTSLTKDVKDERYVERFINKYSERIIATYNPDGEALQSYVFAGGSSKLDLVTDSDYIGSIEDLSGLQGFYNPETIEINLLMIPGCISHSVITEAIRICEKREDTLLILDTPFGLNAQKAVEYTNGTGIYANNDGSSGALNSSHAAVYWPWVKVDDPYTKEQIWLPPSGHIVAQIAYSDKQSYPWFAPAGLNRGIINSIVDIEYSPSQGERDLVYGNRNVVNPLVKFVGQGIVIWGQKTTQRKCSASDRVNVRRLINYLKKVIRTSTRYYIFEPNDQHTWSNWVDMVEPKLQNIKTQRGIYDLKIEMNPNSDNISNYEMPAKIWIKPTLTSEYIPIDFMLMPNNVSFKEDLATQ